ncbi:MAG: hypothetical protein R2762_02255 [Bryobacteraceae bacterium]
MSRSSTRSRRNRNARQSAASLMAMTAPQPPLTPTPPPELTLEQALDLVKSVQVGADRPAVISQLGKPAATILIPESSGLREVLYYTSHGDMIGAVSVNPEGSVTEVRTKP